MSTFQGMEYSFTFDREGDFGRIAGIEVLPTESIAVKRRGESAAAVTPA